VKAVKNSISSVERKILETHLSACVKSSLEGSKDYEKKVNELLKVLKR
jgi:DNA-binding FrmR family transcriptional regulator